MAQPDEFVVRKLHEILAKYPKEEYEGSVVFLVDDIGMQEIVFLENGVKGKSEPLDAKAVIEGSRKRGPFYPYGKIINPLYPAYKYSYYMAHTPMEIFDREKVLKQIPREISVWKNAKKMYLEEDIAEADPPLSEDEATRRRNALEDEISIEEQNIERLLEDFESYNVVITSHEKQQYYPNIYCVLNLNHNKSDKEKVKPGYKKLKTHLRKDVPNILWHRDDRPYSELKTNDRVGRIVKTHTKLCDTIYIKPIDELVEGVDK